MDVKELQMNTTEFEAVMNKCSHLGITRELLAICGGTWPKARLLSALAYWFRPGKKNGNGRAVKFRDGLYWVYKTAEEWRAEIGLTEWEFRTALNALEAMGLIEHRSMKASNAKRQWVKQLHLSLDKNLLLKMIDAVQATHDFPHAASVPDLPHAPVVAPHQDSAISLVAPSVMPVLSDSQNDSTEGSYPLKANTNTGGVKPAKASSGENKTKTTGKTNTGTKELEKEAEQVVDPSSNVRAMGLDALWLSKTGRVEPLTAKQRGQLHGLVKKAGCTAYDATAWAVAHWSEFGSHAVNKSATSCPFAPNIDYLVKHFSTAFELWYRTLWGPKQDEVRAFLIKRGDWWHTVPGLQEKIGVVTGMDGDLYVSEKHPLTCEAAWSIYLKTETAEQKAKRLNTSSALYYAQEAAKAAPNDDALQANYLAAKQARDDYEAAEEKALEQLGWVKEVQVAA